MHADAYFGTDGKIDAPTAITLPAPSVGRVTHENTLGEFETRLLLFQFTQDLDLAARAAMGWDGDRFAIVRTPQGDALVWLTLWDSDVDAVDFFGAMSDVVPRRYEGAAAAATHKTSFRRARIATSTPVHPALRAPSSRARISSSRAIRCNASWSSRSCGWIRTFEKSWFCAISKT